VYVLEITKNINNSQNPILTSMLHLVYLWSPLICSGQIKTCDPHGDPHWLTFWLMIITETIQVWTREHLVTVKFKIFLGHLPMYKYLLSNLASIQHNLFINSLIVYNIFLYVFYACSKWSEINWLYPIKMFIIVSLISA
jgi:hypothetical protein